MHDEALEKIIGQLRSISLQCRDSTYFIYRSNGEYHYCYYKNLNHLEEDAVFILMMINGTIMNISL